MTLFGDLWSCIDLAVILFLYGLLWICFMVCILKNLKIKAQLSALELRGITGSRGSNHPRGLLPTRQIHISSTISSPNSSSSYLHNSYNPSDLPPTYPRSSSSSHFRDHRIRDTLGHSRDHTRDHSRQHSSRRNFSINPSPLSYSFISSSDHYSCNSDD